MHPVDKRAQCIALPCGAGDTQQLLLLKTVEVAMDALARYPKGLGGQRPDIVGMLLDVFQDKLTNLRASVAHTHHGLFPLCACHSSLSST